MQDAENILVPLIVFSTFAILVALLLWYQLSKKRAFLIFLKDREDLSADAITALGKQFFASRNDLRRSIFLIGIALALWGFSFVVDFPKNGNLDLNHAIVGIGLFPFLTGLAYLILHRLERR